MESEFCDDWDDISISFSPQKNASYPVRNERQLDCSTPTAGTHMFTANSRRRRKVPGPAGTLPRKRTSAVAHKQHKRVTNQEKTEQENSISVLSQNASFECEESELIHRAKEECGPLIWDSIEKYSIANVLDLVTKGSLPRGKIPVICGFLDDIELLPMDAKAVLRDRSGSVGCTIHRSVVKEYREQLANSALLLLKQVSLFSPTGKKFYINITLSNIVRVYTSSPSAQASHYLMKHTPFTKEDVDTLEAECLRPVSPPPLTATAPPTLPSRHSYDHPSRSTGSVSTPRMSLSSPDTSAYRLRPSLSTPVRTPQLSQTPRQGLGSLIRTPIRPLSCLSNLGQQSPSIRPTLPESDLEVRLRAHSIMDDNMDDLLCSLADESMFNL